MSLATKIMASGLREPEKVILEVNAPLGILFIHVPLPYTARSAAIVAQELDEIRPFAPASEIRKIQKHCAWLPRTIEELAETERLHGSMDWHTAAARAMGRAECGCPMCK